AAKPFAEREREMPKPTSWVHRRSMLWAVASVAVALLALLAWLNAGDSRHRLWARATPIQIRSIAVLPLDNLSGDPGQEYFADGMTDALITNLGQIGSLKVISRTSVMGYKGTRKPLPEIAKALDVDGIVEGAVIRSGERVRVDAQLIEASTDRHFWAKTYERNLGDVIALQNEVAQAIANEIQVKLTPAEQARLARTHSVDPQAHEFYEKGLYFWNKRPDPAVRKGIDYFQQAIQRDPTYALAYAGLANAYSDSPDLSPEEAYSKSKAMARIALEMDGGVAEAHTALAMIYEYALDWAGAEAEFRRAIALNPGYALAHQWYGNLLNKWGRTQDAIAEHKRAHQLDPLTLVYAGGGEYLKSGQYDQYIELQRKKLELDPNYPNAYLTLGRVYTFKGTYPEAIAHLQKA